MKSQSIPLTNDQIVELAPAAGAINPHETVSDRYSFVPTIEAVDLLRSVGWQPVHVKQSGTRKNDRSGYQKHIIRFMQGALSIDQERVDLVMTNSHDRGCAFQLCASIWRKICGNGLMVSSKLFNFSHRHVNFDTTSFLNSAYQIAEGAGDIAVQANDLKAIDLSPNEKDVFAMLRTNWSMTISKRHRFCHHSYLKSGVTTTKAMIYGRHSMWSRRTS